MPKLIDRYIKETLEKIEQKLQTFIPEMESSQAILYQAARYSLLGAGKRIRPLFLLATSETLGGSEEKALVPACALEMIHTYSLIHDDLPCMDNDDFRRGKPSLHKQYTEGIATLAGDYLLTFAFELIAKAEELTDKQKVQLIKILASRSGGEGMIGGQILDLQADSAISLESLKEIHAKKTADMIIAALEMGAVCAESSYSHRQLLTDFGSAIGIAFQIIDDVLDIAPSDVTQGSFISSDQFNGKTTYATLLGTDQSIQTAEKLLTEALELLQKLPFDTELLAELAKMVIHRTK